MLGYRNILKLKHKYKHKRNENMIKIKLYLWIPQMILFSLLKKTLSLIGFLKVYNNIFKTLNFHSNLRILYL